MTETWQEKFNRTSNQCKQRYISNKVNRPCVIFVPDIHKSQISVECIRNGKKVKETRHTASIVCSANKKNGKPCTAIAKNGTRFCGRHQQKVKLPVPNLPKPIEKIEEEYDESDVEYENTQVYDEYENVPNCDYDDDETT